MATHPPPPPPPVAGTPSLEGRVFVGVSNSDTGQVSAATEFHYHETGSTIWADYHGGEIVRGYLVGTRTGDQLNFRYVHLSDAHTTQSGVCESQIVLLRDGRIRLEESWAWESRPETGTSVLEERATSAR